jgi:hypothetical protein
LNLVFDELKKSAYLVNLMLPDIKPTNRGYATMSKNNVVEIKNRDTLTDALTDLLKTGAQQLIQQAVQVELAEFMGSVHGPVNQ